MKGQKYMGLINTSVYVAQFSPEIFILLAQTYYHLLNYDKQTLKTFIF